MKFLSAASSEVTALLDLLKVCQANNDMVRTESVQKSYRNIAKIYANNARRSPMASQANLDELLTALNAKVLECNVKSADAKADAIASQYAQSAKVAMDAISVQTGGSEDAGTELA
jgi:hypothetical protein